MLYTNLAAKHLEVKLFQFPAKISNKPQSTNIMI